MSIHDELQERIGALRTLAGVGREVAEDAARVVEAELRRSIAAGETPDGEKWKEKKDGGRPLVNAAGSLGVAAVGGTVFVRLAGPEARHDQGRARGGIVRRVIPNSGRVPARMAVEIRDLIDAAFSERLGGGK